jgi:asparagine synthase (glutamine-hydrolysing)
MFRAPMDSFAKGSADGREAWIDQVLSPESLKRTGFFDPAAVADARKTLSGRGGGVARVGLEMGLTAVASTQLWHHLFVSGNLADVQSQVNKSQVASRPAEPAA